MDWARDNTGLSDRDLEKVFKYEPKQTTVIRKLGSDKTPKIWSLESDREWMDWSNRELPSIDSPESGLVFIVARRTGEPSLGKVQKVGTADWLDRINEVPIRSMTHRALTFVSMGEKSHVPAPAGPASGRRSLRTLPFSEDSFRLITEQFHIHGSIARVISRADVPVFSGSEVLMSDAQGTKYPAIVYNCRSSNAWEMDLALTATYFPHCGLTYAILFGCPVSIEQEIIKRLSFAVAESAHPLLLPGIFAEIERSRHVNLVESTIDELEARIFELDFQTAEAERQTRAESERRNQEKRTAWLDTTYLRNGLVSWVTQLRKMTEQIDDLDKTIFSNAHSADSQARTQAGNEIRSEVSSSHGDSIAEAKQIPESSRGKLKDVVSDDESSEDDVESVTASTKDIGAGRKRMQRFGQKIKDRLQDIINEYDDKIRDCSMRVDGMAMATQWAYGETNVEIALATSRDSKYMRSIALVTMIFLPGTFLASVFSMTFFNWFDENADAQVSRYIWIYVLVTVVCTGLTLMVWYYFLVWRPSRPPKRKSEEEIPLV